MIQIISPFKLLFKYTNHNTDELVKILSEFTGLPVSYNQPNWYIGETQLAPNDGYAIVEYKKGFTTKNKSLSELYSYATNSTNISINYMLADLGKLKDYVNQMVNNIDNHSDDRYKAAYGAFKEVTNIINKMYGDYTGPQLDINPIPDPTPYIPPPPGDPIQPPPSPIEPPPPPTPSPSPVTFTTSNSPAPSVASTESTTTTSKKKPPRTQTRKKRRNKKFSESRDNQSNQ